MALVSGGYSLSPNGSTLAAGAAITVTVSGAPPIPQDLSYLGLGGPLLEIVSTTGDGVLAVVDAGGGSSTIVSSNGSVFTDLVSVREVADGCLVTATPSLDFGNVPVGSTSQSTVCSNQVSVQCSGTGSTGLFWVLLPGTGVCLAPCGGSSFSAGSKFASTNGDCWAITFAPQTVGPQTGTITLQRAGSGPFCQSSPGSFPVTGTGIAADAGVVSDAGPG
jgi:hypothetical protein